MKPLGMDAQEWVAGLTGVWTEFLDVLETAWEVGKGVVGMLSGESAQEAGAGVVALRQKIAAREEAERNARLNAPQIKDAALASAAQAGDEKAYQKAGGTFEAFQAQRLKLVNAGKVEATAKDRATFGDKITAKPAKVQGGAAASKGGNSVQMGGVAINVTVPPGTPANMANEMARIAGREMDKRTRRAMAAVREQGA
jgi:hypothetical protein